MNIDLDASILSDDLVIDWSGYKDWFDTNQNGAWYIPKGEDGHAKKPETCYMEASIIAQLTWLV